MGNVGMLQKWTIEMERFCAYQERSEYEVRVKLAKRGASEADINTVLSKLIEQNFLNQSRFALAYAQGKSSIKRWGPQKIKAGLMAHRVTPALINEALNSISGEDQVAQLNQWFKKKEASLANETNGPKKEAKIIRFLLSKGFPLAMVLEAVKA